MPADMVAEPSVAKAVELMTKAEVWTSGSPVEPSAFGLSSLSVRAIVTAMTSQMGVQACDSKNPLELLRLCAVNITAILAKGGSAAGMGVGGGGVSSGMSTIADVNPSSSAAASSSTGGGGSSTSGGMPPLALLDVSGAVADHQAKSEGAMFAASIAKMLTDVPVTQSPRGGNHVRQALVNTMDNTTLVAEISTLKSEVVTLTGKVGRLEGENGTLNGENGVLKDEVGTLKGLRKTALASLRSGEFVSAEAVIAHMEALFQGP